MRYHILLASLIAFSDLTGLACAESRSDSAGRPSFDSGEVSAITRNELLVALVDTDPWLVRRILDKAALGETAGRHAMESVGIDPDLNPDLAGSRRDALASVQWINLLKKAKAEKDGLKGAASSLQPQTRSTEGSVELIDMIKRAKAAKQASQ